MGRYVQDVATGGGAAASATLVLTVGATVKVGNHVLVAVGTRGATFAGCAITDSKGNTWQTDLTAGGTAGAGGALASGKITTALVPTDTITITLTGGTPFICGVAIEVEGLDPTTWFDKSVAANGTGAASDSTATAATTKPGEFLFGATYHQSTVTTYAPEVVSPVWNQTTTASSTVTVGTIRPMYRGAQVTGTFSAKATWTTSRIWESMIATYIDAPGKGRQINVGQSVQRAAVR